MEIPKSLNGVIEALAASVHDTWAETKLAQKITDHPDLIPYGQLSEPTKDYDRSTVKATIKGLYALGYTVEKVIGP